MGRFSKRIHPFVAAEIIAADTAEARADFSTSFAHLERAHVLGQASTAEHVRVHWHMLRWGIRRRDVRECIGQLFRLIGAATKTAVGLVPHGNTGGSNISPFKPMPVPADLAEMIAKARD